MAIGRATLQGLRGPDLEKGAQHYKEIWRAVVEEKEEARNGEEVSGTVVEEKEGKFVEVRRNKLTFH